MNRFGFLVLSILNSNGADSKYQAMSVQEIKEAECLEYEPDTFYRQLKKFVIDGLVGQGAKDPLCPHQKPHHHNGHGYQKSVSFSLRSTSNFTKIIHKTPYSPLFCVIYKKNRKSTCKLNNIII